MLLYPNTYFSKIQEITIEYLIKNKIKVLILDMDNTLIDKNRNIPEEIEKWVKELKGQGTKLYILSNTNNKEKIEKVAKKLQIPYKYFAKKPLKAGFLNIQREVGEKSDRIAVVGDQIFTDIIGGNRCNMHTILVEPINKKEYWYTAWKRPIEEKIKKKYRRIETKEKK